MLAGFPVAKRPRIEHPTFVFTFQVGHSVELATDQIWPDLDAPDAPTAQDARAAVERFGGPEIVLRRWLLDRPTFNEVDVDVDRAGGKISVGPVTLRISRGRIDAESVVELPTETALVASADDAGAIPISSTLSLSVDFVTKTQAVVARKGSGKSYTGRNQAEGLLALGQQIVVIDPTGAWWGLRSSADGKSAGFPIAVLGGDHGDIPLDPASGEAIAESVVSQGFSAVLDLSLLKRSRASGFVADFLEALYRLNREAMHLFVDEADLFAPQVTRSSDVSRALDAMNDIVRRGRIRGIGATLITQRAQVISKDVLSQVDMLTAMRMSHPKDLAAVREWVDVHADPARSREMVASLPGLPVGEAWIWAPGSGLFERVKIRRCRTFDSSRTPRAGERVSSPKVLAPIDIARLGKTIADTAARAQEDDPTVLRARIAELRQQIERVRASAVPVEVPVEVRVEVPTPVLPEVDLAKFEFAVARLDATRKSILGDLTRELASVGQATKDLEAAVHLAASSTSPPLARPAVAVVAVETPSRAERAAPAPADRGVPASGRLESGDPSLGLGERKILAALAQYAGGLTKRQVAVITGYAANGGGFQNYLSSLRSRGLIRGDQSNLQITDAGVAALGHYDPLPTGRALFEYWLGHRQLGRAEREILRVLHEEWPRSHPKQFIAMRAGYKPDGGGFQNALSRLRTLQLIEGKSKIKANDQLQDGGR